ncbi:MAG: DUF3887 domain-containing protein [Xenococcus sp. (in: cyanobacteria)]
MKRINKKFFIAYVVIVATISSGAMTIHPSKVAIAQTSQAKNTRAERLKQAEVVTKKMFDSLNAEQYEQAINYFSPSMKNYFSAQELELEWQKILKNMGAFVKYKKIRSTQVFDTYTVLVSARFEKIITDFVLTLDSNQQITAVDFLWLGNIQENAEEFIDAVANGQYTLARGYLDPKTKQTLLPEEIEQEWQEIIEEAGQFKRRSDSQVIESSRSDVVLIDLEFAKENRSIMIIFNPLMQIVGVDFPDSPE